MTCCGRTTQRSTSYQFSGRRPQVPQGAQKVVAPGDYGHWCAHRGLAKTHASGDVLSARHSKPGIKK